MFLKTVSAVAVSLALVSAASAATIPNGTASSAHLFNPTVNVTTSPATYSAMNGGTFEVSGKGGFATAAGKNGTLNGTLTFSNVEGTTLNESLNNFFVFDDGVGGTFNFSVTSVMTQNFANDPGVNTGIQLYLLGNTTDTNLGYTSTATSLTITANSTNGSAYSSSATLAVPPAPVAVTPEPSSVVLLGSGLLSVAGIARRRFKK